MAPIENGPEGPRRLLAFHLRMNRIGHTIAELRHFVKRRLNIINTDRKCTYAHVLDHLP